MPLKRSYYDKPDQNSSENRSYGGGREGFGHGGGYPSKGEVKEKKLKYASGDRIFHMQSFKVENKYGQTSPTRGIRSGPKAKSQRKGERKSK